MRLAQKARELAGRYEGGGSPSDLEDAIQLWVEAIDAAGMDSPDTPHYLLGLGTGFRLRYELTRHFDDLDRSRRVLATAVGLTSQPDLDWELQDSVGTTRAYLYLHTGEIVHLNSAIAAHEVAAMRSREGAAAEERALLLHNLARDYLYRFRATSDAPDLDGAIARWAEVLMLLPAEHPQASLVASSYAEALEQRFGLWERTEDLELAVKVRRAALAMLPEGAEALSSFEAVATDLTTLAGATNDPVVIERVIETWTAMRRWAANAHPRVVPAVLNNVAACLLVRYEHTKRLADLTEAIEALEEAVALAGPNGPHAGHHHEMLARTLEVRYRRTGSEQDQQRASQLHRQAEAAARGDGAPALNSPEQEFEADDDVCAPEEEGGHSRRIRTLVEEVIATATWSEARRLLHEHGELLDSAVDAMFAEWTEATLRRGRLDQATALEPWRELLRRARDVGIDAAIREAAGGEPLAPLDLSPVLERAVRLWKNYRGGDAAALSKALSAWDAVAAHPAWREADPAVRRFVSESAARGYTATYQHSLGREAVASARLWWERAVADSEPGSEDLATALTGVGASSRALFRLSGRPEALNEAIRAYERAIAEAPSDLPGRANLVGSLGLGLLDRASQQNDRYELDRAVEALEQAVAAVHPDSPFRSTHLGNLGRALTVRYGVARRREDLDRSIDVLAKAAEGPTWTPEEQADCLHRLGARLVERYRVAAEAGDLEGGIRAYREALSTPEDTWYGRPRCLSDLGRALTLLHERSGEFTDIEDALRVVEEALRIAPESWPDRADCLNNLGSVFRALERRGGDSDHLRRAVEAFEQAVAASPPEVSSRLNYLNNLANALADIATQHDTWGAGLPVATEFGEELERAIDAYTEVLSVASQSWSGRPTALANLSTVLSARASRRGSSEDLARAESTVREALASVAPSSPARWGWLANLATVLRVRHDWEPEPTVLQEGIEAFRTASREMAVVEPSRSVQTALTWGVWATEREAWLEAAEAFGAGLDSGERLVRRQLLRRHKEAWLSYVGHLARAGSYALARAGRSKEAVLMLERGRSLLLWEALELRRFDPEQFLRMGRNDLYERYRRVLQAVESPDAPQDDTVPLLHEFDQLVADMRAVPGFEDLFCPPTFDGVVSAARAGPLVYVVPSLAGGVAFIVDPSGDVRTIELKRLTEKAVQERIAAYFGAYDPAGADRRPWLRTLDETTRWLWEAAMGPVVAQLTPAGRTTLIVSGYLGLLPLHAAWVEDTCLPSGRRYVADALAVSYAPSARTLAATQELASAVAPEAILAVEDPPSGPFRPLAFARQEVEDALAWFERGRRLHDEASRSTVVGVLRYYSVLHFACHGVASGEPLENALVVAGGERVTLADLLDAQVSARLAVLSACETGLAGGALPEEVIGLPAGFLKAGVAGVVASLWSVPDAATRMLLGRFYELWRGEALEPVEALRRAQLWIRDSTNGEKRGRYPDMPAPDAQGSTPAMRFWETAREHASPYHWAGFAYVGA